MLATVFGCSRSCRPCGEEGEKNHNTVKVDAAALSGKENAAPQNNPNIALSMEEQDRIKKQWEAKQTEARPAEEQRREMERRVKEEQERQLAEQRRREAEARKQQLEREQREREIAQEQLRQQQEEQRQRLAEEYRRQEEARLAAEKAEAAKQAAEQERLRKQQIENEKKVQAWLQKNGFKNVNDLVRKRLSKVRPLHVVVQQRDVEMAKLLVAAGADTRLTSGKNETAAQLAQRLNNSGSHAPVLSALAGKA